MLHLHLSNRTEALLEALLGRLCGPGEDPFQPDQLLVPSAGVRRWLTLAIAARQGICAQVRFDFLAPWLWRLTAAVRPDVPAESPLAAAPLSWRVLAALEDERWRSGHDVLARWLAGADPLMRWELALRVAALFEQYQTYRPDWLQAWAAAAPGGSPRRLAGGALAADAEAGPHARWQAALWQRLVGELQTLPHPARDLGPALARGSVPLPARVHVFALPSMPPAHLALLRAAGQATDVHLYLLNPCREYWFDIVSPRLHARLAARGRLAHHETGHRLLAAWGQATREHLGAVFDAADEASEDEERWQAPHGSAGKSLLRRLQQSLLDLVEPAAGSWPLDPGDRSLELHLAHSRVRELEVLQDRLLGLFAADATLEPSDVLVVTPELDATAPLVDAIFGTAPEARRIPYAVSGLGRSRRNELAAVLLELLDLQGGRHPASRVLSLLQRPPVARRFGLDAEALDELAGALPDAGLHWSLDQTQREQLGLPGLPPFGWAEALERLFLSHALPPGPSAPFAGVVAVDRAAGLAGGLGACALGGLWRFVEALRALHGSWSRPLAAARWPASLSAALAEFVASDADTVEEHLELQQVLERLQAHLEGAGPLPDLPAAVVHHALERLLDDPPHGGVGGGGVTFTSMSSLRGVPFRVVCAIGLDDGVFPSPQRPAEFDLMAAAPRRGDRQRRQDERALLLDLLLAARDTVHLSCRGRDPHHDSPLPPSVLVAELLDFLLDATSPTAGLHDSADCRRAARERLVVQHPLQPFGQGAFDRQADPRLRSHDSELAAACRARLQAATATWPPAPAADTLPTTGDDRAGRGADGDADEAAGDADPLDDDTQACEAVGPVPGIAPFIAAALPAPAGGAPSLSLTEIADMLRHPARQLLRARLGLELPQADEGLQDDEAFDVDLPRRRALGRRLLPLLARGADIATVQAAARASAWLPAGALGEAWLAQELPVMQAHAAERARREAGPRLPPQSAVLTIDIGGMPHLVQARWHDMRPSGLQFADYDELRVGTLLQAWVGHLAWCAARPGGPGGEPAAAAPMTHGLARAEAWTLRPCDSPLPLLAALASLALQGRSELLPWLPRSAWAWHEGGRKIAAARGKWRGNPQGGNFPESLDPYTALAWRGRPDPLEHEAAAFEALAQLVLDPLVDHLQREPLPAAGEAS